MKHLADLPVNVIAGSSLANLQCKPLSPYSPEAIAFLSEWSQKLIRHSEIRTHPDVASFAFWCREGNLVQLSRDFAQKKLRLGRGLALHIAPTNVPVNFAYSFAFGLLAGNANVVRVPESLPAQAKFLCTIADQLLADPKHARVVSMTTLISYPRDDAVTKRLSAMADVRILWGGDQTIENLRRMPTSPRCVDIPLADRYSLCLLSAPAVLAAAGSDFAALITGFYNDAFIMDQNACSSPHLVLWQGNLEEVTAAQDRFWGALHSFAGNRGNMLAIQAVEKYTHLCRFAIGHEGAISAPVVTTRIVRVSLEHLPDDITSYRGRNGFFVESLDADLSQLFRIVNSRYQTLTCFGFDLNTIAQQVASNGSLGIDRVVSVGNALNINVIWDGFDIIGTMSRIIATT